MQLPASLIALVDRRGKLTGPGKIALSSIDLERATIAEVRIDPTVNEAPPANFQSGAMPPARSPTRFHNCLCFLRRLKATRALNPSDL